MTPAKRNYIPNIQKDFKVQAMHVWKYGKKFAIVVSPLYQLPAQRSQIYQQAITLDVCLLSFSHIAMLLSYAMQIGETSAQSLLGSVLRRLETLNPSVEASAYWTPINRTFIEADDLMSTLWQTEKLANLEAIAWAKEEGLHFLATERESIMKLSHDEALNRLMQTHNIVGRRAIIESIHDNGLLDLM